MKNVNLRKHHREHPWVFSNEIKHKEDIEPGEIINIYQGRSFLGRGFYNPHSLIAVRLFSSTEQEFDQQFIDEKVNKALELRMKFTKNNSFRLIYSESDGLPGLIVDKYENNYVIQINCYGIDKRRDMIINSLIRMTPGFIYERSDTQLRRLEGLEDKQGILYGTLANPVLIRQDGIPFLVDVERGQKTGFFFDLADIRKKVKEISKDRTVLDLFCHTGSFSLYAVHGGAIAVTGVDSSEPAIALAIENSKRAGIKLSKFICADAFDFLRNDRQLYEVIIVDPPSFAKSKKSLIAARRGYKEINLQAMKHLNRGGMLVTTSCSYHISEEGFQEILRKSAIDAGIGLRIIGRATQSLDHPILLNMPESHYLKCLFLQRID
jgi:23S rRNA (cytosine1962-C5)-methyltransferase